MKKIRVGAAGPFSLVRDRGNEANEGLVDFVAKVTIAFTDLRTHKTSLSNFARLASMKFFNFLLLHPSVVVIVIIVVPGTQNRLVHRRILAGDVREQMPRRLQQFQANQWL